MTDQNNAAQAAEQDPLSDEYVNALTRQHGYGHPIAVAARLWKWIGLHGGENSVTLLMYEAHKALFKLRAEGVQAGGDPLAAEEAFQAWMDRFPEISDVGRLRDAWNDVRASAPVAGEAQRLDAPAQVGGTRFGKGIHWSTVIMAAQSHYQYMQDPAREAERIAQAKQFQAFVAGNAAPQASTVDGLPVWWERFMNELTLRSEDEVRNDLAGILEICALDAIASAAPQASEAVRIQFPAHLRKMWSGGEVQAWLDEHQGVTPPKVSAKGSLERYRKWQAEREEAFGAGVKAAADLVKKMVDDYDTDHGSTDPETGTREYPGDGAAWVCDMEELEGSIRALSAQPAQKEQSDE